MAAAPGPKQMLERLQALQRDLAETPWPHRRDALLRSLRHEVEQVPRDARSPLLASLRHELLQDNGIGSSRREAALTGELEELRGQRDAARSELAETRGQLAELEALREENRRLRAAPAGATSSGGGGDVAGLLTKLAKGNRIDDELEAMPERDRSALRAVMMLFGFVVDHEVMSMAMLHGLAGDVDAMGTQVLQGMRRGFSKRFLGAIEDPEGGLPALKEQLTRSTRLVMVLESALIKVAKGGSEKILDQLDPDGIAEQHTRPLLGTDWGNAFKTLRKEHGQIDHYMTKEVWELYFQPSFRKELKKFLDP